MPRNKKTRKLGAFEMALVVLLTLGVGAAGYKIFKEGTWRVADDPLANLTLVEVDAVQQQARKTWEEVKDKKVQWGTSFEAPLARIQSEIMAADSAYDAGDLDRAYTQYQSACDRIAKMKTAIESSREAILSRNGSIELRDLGKRYQANTLQPAPWAQAEGLMEEGHVAFQSRSFEEARQKYREAGKIFQRLEEYGGNLQAYRKVQQQFVAQYRKTDHEKLKNFGGAHWASLEKLISTSADEAADPAIRRRAFEKALIQLPEVVAFADSEERRIRYDALVKQAAERAGREEWSAAAEAAAAALQTGHIDFHEALGFLENILAASKTMAGFEVGLPVAIGVWLPVVWIPAGSFRMGSTSEEADEGPVHDVVLTRPFWLGKYEISQQLYRNVSGKLPPHQLFGPDLPVSRVTWNEASAFCELLGERLDRTARLPTEGEWEYACRAGTATAYHCGDTLERLVEYANFCNRTCRYQPRDEAVDDGYAAVTPCGTFKPNNWGLHDMHGNVMEWCADGYDGGFYAKSSGQNPLAPAASMRVLRGGAWQFNASLARSAARYRYPPSHSNDYIGFRVVLEVSASGTTQTQAR